MDELLSKEQIKVLKKLEKKETLSASEFSLSVEDYVNETKESYVDSILILSELHGIDMEKVSKYLTETLKQKLAKEHNLVTKVYNIDSALPIGI